MRYLTADAHETMHRPIIGIQLIIPQIGESVCSVSFRLTICLFVFLLLSFLKKLIDS
jgi:hypothetical protein